MPLGLPRTLAWRRLHGARHYRRRPRKPHAWRHAYTVREQFVSRGDKAVRAQSMRAAWRCSASTSGKAHHGLLPPDVTQPDGYRAAFEEKPDDSWKTM
jgi:hypothetical protein